MHREAGLFQLVAYGVGNIIGAGIYVLVGEASGLAGRTVWLAFLIGAVIAAFTSLSYAELAPCTPSSIVSRLRPDYTGMPDGKMMALRRA